MQSCLDGLPSPAENPLGLPRPAIQVIHGHLRLKGSSLCPGQFSGGILECRQHTFREFDTITRRRKIGSGAAPPLLLPILCVKRVFLFPGLALRDLRFPPGSAASRVLIGKIRRIGSKSRLACAARASAP